MSARNNSDEPAAYPLAIARALGSTAAVADCAPSVTSLGVHLAAVRKARHLFDVASLARVDKANTERPPEIGLLDDRAEAIRDMIASQPALSLPDAAVAVAEAAIIAARLSADGDMPHAAVRAADKIERMLLAALPFVAQAASLDMHAMEWAEADSLRVARFQTMGVQS